MEHPSEYWRVSFHPWPCARGVASNLMLPGQLVRPPLSRSLSLLCCAAMPARKQHTSSNSSKASLKQWCS
eukprot:1156135-Pelagomonas_calceolata.AAC.2